ncbi:MAG TPA: LytTR family DNA-binding domain-containing protein [Acidobacteriaceae bacterium]
MLLGMDPLTTSAVRTQLLKHSDFEIYTESCSGSLAPRMLRELQPDAIFMDAIMLESSDLSRRLSQPVKRIVVFLTEHKEDALCAFDWGAADCLLKPIRDDRLELALNRIRALYTHRQTAETHAQAQTAPSDDPLAHSLTAPGRITVTGRQHTHVFEAEEIEWIGAADDYTELHVRGATHLLREPLSVLLGRLPANAFCRIHRSFAVNLSRVSGFKTLRNQDLLVKLKDRTVLRASRTFSDELRRAICTPLSP